MKNVTIISLYRIKLIRSLILFVFFLSFSSPIMAQCTAPVVTFSVATDSICSGNATSITLWSNIPGTTFQWIPTPNGVTGASMGFSGTINQTLTAPGTSSGTVVYTITASANGCTATDTNLTITVLPTPVITSTSSASICSGTSPNVPLTSNMTSTYSWTIGTIVGSITGASINSGSFINQVLTNSSHQTAGSVVYNVTPTTNNCAGYPTSITVTVNPVDDANFSYSSATYCQSGNNPTPNYNPNAKFTSSPTGLLIDSLTGTIDLASSSIGTYTILNSTTGLCPSSSSITMTITAAPSASFNYSSSSYCNSSPNQTPLFGIGASAGIFSASPSGLIFNNINTGVLDIVLSSPGIYIVTDSIPASGGCTTSLAKDTVTILPNDDDSFTYISSLFCTNAATESPVITGTIGGTFSASPNGLNLNSNSGAILFSSSTIGNYTITYTTNGNCPASSSVSVAIDSICASISGSIYMDSDHNCIFSSNDYVMSNFPVKLYDANNNFIAIHYSSYSGLYHFSLPTGTYTVKVDTTNYPISINCINQGLDSTVTLTSGSPSIPNVDFGFSCATDCGINALMLNTAVLSPNQQRIMYIYAGDASFWNSSNCRDSSSAQLQLSISGPANYSGYLPGSLPPIVSNNNLTYNIPNLTTINYRSAFRIHFIVDSTAQIGDSICVSVSMACSGFDINPSNNYKHFCYYVGTSYDPNVKEVYPVNVLPGYDDWFYYTIHFQNTGTAPAVNISVKDTLDSNLDLETFELVTYSDTLQVSLNRNALNFYFPNIMLPDSTSDQEGSKGFVQYRIKPKANLQAGVQIKNTAYIYFDYNAPVVTNTTINEYLMTTSISASNQDQSIKVYPNPSSGIYQLELPKRKTKTETIVSVYNLYGALILSEKAEQEAFQINLSKQPSGIYILKVNCNQELFNLRIIKE